MVLDASGPFYRQHDGVHFYKSSAGTPEKKWNKFMCNPDFTISLKDYPEHGYLGVDGSRLVLTNDHNKVKYWFNGNMS